MKYYLRLILAVPSSHTLENSHINYHFPKPFMRTASNTMRWNSNEVGKAYFFFYGLINLNSFRFLFNVVLILLIKVILSKISQGWIKIWLLLYQSNKIWQFIGEVILCVGCCEEQLETFWYNFVSLGWFKLHFQLKRLFYQIGAVILWMLVCFKTIDRKAL